MSWQKDPMRVAINQHLHRHHGGAAVGGDTDARYVAHELMHIDEGNDEDVPHWIAAGKPLHTHVRLEFNLGGGLDLTPNLVEGESE